MSIGLKKIYFWYVHNTDTAGCSRSLALNHQKTLIKRKWIPNAVVGPWPQPLSEMELVSSTSHGAGAVGSGAEASPLLFFRFAIFRPTAGCQPPLRVPAPCTILMTSKPPLTHTGAGPGVRYCATNTSFLVSYTVASFAKHFRIPTPLFELMGFK